MHKHDFKTCENVHCDQGRIQDLGLGGGGGGGA